MSRVLFAAFFLAVCAVAIPSASALDAGPGSIEINGRAGGCATKLVSDLGSNPTWENLFGDIGRFIDCTV